MAEPFRRCVGCRRLHPRSQLIRIVRDREGQVSIDTGRKIAPGRGAYVCRKEHCWQVVRQRRSLEKALKVLIPGQFWAVFEEFFTS